MRYKTLFRVLLKLLGVYFFVTGLAQFVTMLAFVIGLPSRGAAPGTVSWQATNLIGPAIDIVSGVYLFFWGRQLVDLAVPGNRPYCPECGYELTGFTGSLCPECGNERPSGRQE